MRLLLLLRIDIHPFAIGGFIYYWWIPLQYSWYEFQGPRVLIRGQEWKGMERNEMGPRQESTINITVTHEGYNIIQLYCTVLYCCILHCVYNILLCVRWRRWNWHSDSCTVWMYLLFTKHGTMCHELQWCARLMFQYGIYTIHNVEVPYWNTLHYTYQSTYRYCMIHVQNESSPFAPVSTLLNLNLQFVLHAAVHHTRTQIFALHVTMINGIFM